MPTLKKLDRTTVITEPKPIKVLQFGEGNFLRAFADWIIDIVNEETSFNGGIQIIQPLSFGMADQINEQGGLYHVILNGIQQGETIKQARLITAVQGALNPFQNYRAYLKSAENPEVKIIISNTTEAGISFNENDVDASVLAQSFPGKLTQWLFHRFEHFKGSPDKAMIFLPCELIERNGDALKKTILQYIVKWALPPDFTSWIMKHNIFCNTLVDRIVPGFPKDDIEDIQKELGYFDNLVVKAEPFHLWVIEGPDSIKEFFPVHKTNLQVQFTNDLSPYRTRKVRILNGAHTAMVPVAYMKGLHTVQEAVEDVGNKEVVRELIFNEIIPTLELPAEELEAFANDVIERFRNPFIRHELLSIALNSISKFKVRVLPSIVEYQKRKGQLPPLLINSLAQLIIFYRGEYKNQQIPLNDSSEILDFFKQAWLVEPVQMVNMILSNTKLWDRDLTSIEGLEDAVLNGIRALVRDTTKTEQNTGMSS